MSNEMDMARGLTGRLEDVIFSNGGVDKQVRDITTKYIEECWEQGYLPKKEGKKWLVGFLVYKTFFHCYCTGIYVGPARPSKFKKHWQVIMVRKY